MFECISNLNRLLRINSIAGYLSPLTVVINMPKINFNMLTLTFGDYVEVYENNGFQTNSINAKGVPAIALNTTHNSTGSYNFFSLATGVTLEHGLQILLPILE